MQFVTKTAIKPTKRAATRRVDWRKRAVPAKVTDPAERHRVLKRAGSRVKTSARIDTVAGR